MKHKPKNRVSLVLVAVCIVVVISHPQALAQSKPAGAAKSPLCTRDNALDMIKQQVALTKTFNDVRRRITVLIRAADLLWPHEQKRARAVFTEAFDLATEHEKENEQKASRVLILRIQVPDQRHIVIRAVARRDPAWAKELTRQMLKPDREPSATRDAFADLLTGTRLLDSANKLLSEDINSALDLAKTSLNYPASFMLTRFLYKLAEVDQQQADQFYAQALTVYADRPMREFLYLQAYPFAWREMLNTPVFSFFPDMPTNLVPNQSLQRRFVQTLLRRAQHALESPLDPNDTYQDPDQGWLPGTVRILEGLIKLEPQVRASLPDLVESLTQAREKILVSLSVENQKVFLKPGREAEIRPRETFDGRLEAAEKIADADEHDEMLATAVLDSEQEKLERVIETIDQISESTLQARLREWLYFQRTLAASQQKQFDEAEKLATNVEGQEIRAYLHVEIAKGLLNRGDAPTRAQELLETAITEAKKAGVSIFAARSLLTAASLYAKIDLSRSIAVLGDAINCINQIDAPDFVSDDQSLEKTPKRRGRGGRYHGEYLLRFYMPGLDPERAFREMAKSDFDTALSQSNALTDKFQRALSMLSIAEACLQQTNNLRRG